MPALYYSDDGDVGEHSPPQGGGRKRRRTCFKSKLNIGQRVEVRIEEDIFLGPWRIAEVVGKRGRRWDVKYENIWSEDGVSKLIKSVHLSSAINGDNSNRRIDSNSPDNPCSIRPVPGIVLYGLFELPYGLCVDFYFKDAWWEGVIFDNEDGAEERLVFQPDLMDEVMVKVCINNLRITMDWDEVTGQWVRRGTWAFLQMIEKYEAEWPLSVSMKQIWYDVRKHAEFNKLKGWTSTNTKLWEKLMLETIVENLKIAVDDILPLLDLSKNSAAGDGGALEGQKQPPHDNNRDYAGEVCAELVSLDNPMVANKEDCGNSISCSNVVDDAANKLVVPHDGSSDIQPSQESNDLEQGPKSADDNGQNIDICDGSNVPSNDKPSFPSPLKLSLPLHVYSSEGSSDPQPHESEYTPRHSTSRQTEKWGHVSPESLGGAESCPCAISDYLERYHISLVSPVRRHLLYLGWAMASTKSNGQITFRYTSPDGKRFYRLRQACQYLTEKVLHHDDPEDIASASSEADMEPFYCPQAIVDYYMLEQEKIKKSSDIVRVMRLNARKHLLARGWKFEHWDWGRRPVLRYHSPSGKYHGSLRSACEGCIHEDRLQDKTTSYLNILESIVNSEELESGVLNDLSEAWSSENSSQKKVETSCELGLWGKKDVSRKLRRKSSFHPRARENVRITRSLSLRQRAQPVDPGLSQHNPKSILGWLIDNNTILPREKVFCRIEDTSSKAEGRAGRDGIKCRCCNNIFTLSGFAHHAGRSECRPAAAIFLEDGRSLLKCEMETLNLKKIGSPDDTIDGNLHKGENDYICSVCHYGGELILCDKCPSSFHQSCLGLKDVPDGDWFCPSCCCRICGQVNHEEDGEHSQEDSYINCTQCERKYHIRCLGEREGPHHSNENWYCSSTCEKISSGLYELLEKPIKVGSDNLTWTLLKPIRPIRNGILISDIGAETENNCRLSIALDVMHECFEMVKDPFTKRDLVKDIIFNRGSELKRLNFCGFYTVLLERNDELISVANVRIYGDKVAELPLIGTRFQYRRQGMCTVLMNELEKNLKELGVERLVLPAVPSAVNTWTNSFGFTRITEAQRLQLVEYTFLDFQDTQICQKYLLQSP